MTVHELEGSTIAIYLKVAAPCISKVLSKPGG